MLPIPVTAIGIAIVLDLAIQEVPEPVHPVAIFGRLIDLVDRDWSRPRWVGGMAAVTLPLGAALLLGAIVTAVAAQSQVAGAAVAGLVLFCTISLRMLLSVATTVVDLTTTDVDRARAAARALVGRDTGTLSPEELRSAAVESAAENLADGFIAPLTGFVIGAQIGLGAAVGGAVWVKAVNTMDSMLGYEHKPVGWASARLDDLIMWVPARCTAIVLAVVGRNPRAVASADRWARAPPSPNSGWPMATLAAVLDVELRKPDAYVLNPDAALPTPARAYHGIRLVGVTGLIAGATAMVIVWC